MSSSSANLVRRPELVDLQRQQPVVVPGTFDEQLEFEQQASGGARELTPEEAWRNGLAEGERLGREAMRKEITPVLDELRAFARALAIVREQRMLDAEAELIDVATAIARNILHAELESNSEVVGRLARVCIEEAAGESPLLLRTAPADLECVQRWVSELPLDLADGGIQMEADPQLARGAVVLLTPTRAYDSRPERLLGDARRRVEALKGLP
jgi:flagellar biosynthesis/type III secretory pathway protein FliH